MNTAHYMEKLMEISNKIATLQAKNEALEKENLYLKLLISKLTENNCLCSLAKEHIKELENENNQLKEYRRG